MADENTPAPERPQEHARFTVTSGGLCFGDLHCIYHSASAPIQPFDPPKMKTQDKIGGTVMIQEYIHNTCAQNGTWITYQLLDPQDMRDPAGPAVVAWFACHEDVDPQAQVDKILSVAGSPYELDIGSRWNDEKTEKEGVLVVNRYDWFISCGNDVEDEVGKLKIPESMQDGPVRDSGLYNSVGIVDYAHATQQIAEWRQHPADQRMPSDHGAWFFVPNGEYMWVRFGFDDTHTAARSFLFFTINTVFPRTIFRGVSKTLRQEETEEERFLRLLGEGEQFEGFEELKSSANFTVRMDASRVEQGSMDPPQAYKGQPDEAECFGPYEKNEHVLKEADFEAIRVAIEADVEFIDPLKETIFDILNEMVMSWLEETVVPAASLDSVLLTADALCFESTKRMTLLRKEVKAYMLDPVKHPIPGFDFDAVGRRIKDFLKIRCGNDSLVGNDAFIAGVTSSVRYLVAELIKIASNAYFIPERFTPCDIRLKSHWDVEFQIMFRLCKVYWYGR